MSADKTKEAHELLLKPVVDYYNAVCRRYALPFQREVMFEIEQVFSRARGHGLIYEECKTDATLATAVEAVAVLRERYQLLYAELVVDLYNRDHLTVSARIAALAQLGQDFTRALTESVEAGEALRRQTAATTWGKTVRIALLGTGGLAVGILSVWLIFMKPDAAANSSELGPASFSRIEPYAPPRGPFAPPLLPARPVVPMEPRAVLPPEPPAVLQSEPRAVLPPRPRAVVPPAPRALDPGSWVRT